MTLALALAVSLLHAALTYLLLNLFLRWVPLPADGPQLRASALPWLWCNGAGALAAAAAQWLLAGWPGALGGLGLNLYVIWLLWRFGLRKQFPHERPLG